MDLSNPCFNTFSVASAQHLLGERNLSKKLYYTYRSRCYIYTDQGGQYYTQYQETKENPVSLLW